ncbi:MAG: iron-sulfur cluster assembly accessory protein [bacterium]|nr:iron-sulfur cluster assembly accessory protein [bacterium]
MVNVSDRAVGEIRAIFEREQPDDEVGLRLGVVGGGCSGLSYQMDFSEFRSGDQILDLEGVRLLLDPKSAIYLKGVTLDFEDGFSGKGFVFRNPNATNTCGCGESFSI